MQRRTALTALIALAMLISLPGATTAGATRHHHALPTECPATRQLVTADQQAEVYFAREPPEYLAIRACAYKTGRPFTIGRCAPGESRKACSQSPIQLAGADVAYEFGEWHLEVLDLSTYTTLYQVPTGRPLRSVPHHVGVGNIVALVLESNGSAAWIANDYERSIGVAGSHETRYFDVEAVGDHGLQLLAAGTDIDPSSLALATDGSEIGLSGETIEGTTVYWTEAGKHFSAPLL